MTRLEELQHSVTGFLGLRPKSRWERLMEVDWHDYVPTRQDIRNIRRPDVEFDTTSLVVGLIVGVGVGVGIGYALSKDVRPTLTRARRQVRQAMDRVEENLGEIPSRLNITRMEEQKTK